jgi:rhomboid protease GluP
MDNNSASDDLLRQQGEIYKNAVVTLILLGVNVLIYLIGMPLGDAVYNKGALITYKVLMDGEFYRIFTAMFLHAGTEHIVNNMLMLATVGAIVEQYTGHGFFFILYIISGIFGNLLSMAYELRNNLNWISVGASGAIMGIVGFLVVWIIINRQRFVKNKSLMMRIGLLAIFLVNACFFQEGANTVAHLGGFITGVVLGIINIVLLKNRKDMEGIA